MYAIAVCVHAPQSVSTRIRLYAACGHLYAIVVCVHAS
jgi:hypothetical protein